MEQYILPLSVMIFSPLFFGTSHWHPGLVSSIIVFLLNTVQCIRVATRKQVEYFLKRPIFSNPSNTAEKRLHH